MICFKPNEQITIYHATQIQTMFGRFISLKTYNKATRTNTNRFLYMDGCYQPASRSYQIHSKPTINIDTIH